MIFHRLQQLLLLSPLLPIQYLPYPFLNIALHPGKLFEKKEDAGFSDQYVSSWRQYVVDHILTSLFSVDSYPASPAIETTTPLHDGKYPRDYKGRRNASIRVAGHLFFECKLYKKWSSCHPLRETLQMQKDYHTPPAQQIQLHEFFSHDESLHQFHGYKRI